VRYAQTNINPSNSRIEAIALANYGEKQSNCIKDRRRFVQVVIIVRLPLDIARQ
jgi:hypothetical protein